jgi:RNase P/RNase MRP subunit POP5
MTNPTPTLEPIPAKDARKRIQAAILERLGEQWDSPTDGWVVVHDTAYLVRLHRGEVNLDFQCDLLGEVSITELEVNPLQTSGRLIALAVLTASLFLALVLAQISGVLNS